MTALAAALIAKGFRRAWVLDFEFRQPWGARPTPRCMVARCVITGVELRLWLPAPCPFSCGRDELFIAYSASAEMECFLAVGWPPPPNILDLFIEFLALRNGWPRDREHDGLLDALAHFAQPCMDVDDKYTMRKLAMRGGPYMEAEKRELLDYCAEDVETTLRLLGHMWRARRLDKQVNFAQAVWHGRYQGPVAAMRATGVPLNTAVYKRLDANWGRLKTALIEELNPRYGVFVDGHFNHRAFEAYVARKNLLPVWKRADNGALATDKDTLADMAKMFPELEELRQLLQVTGRLRALDLEIGEDGRNRFYIAPFRTKTGRNAPSNSRFVFGVFKGLRNLITPPPRPRPRLLRLGYARDRDSRREVW